jgi:hypothetical protein
MAMDAVLYDLRSRGMTASRVYGWQYHRHRPRSHQILVFVQEGKNGKYF